MSPFSFVTACLDCFPRKQQKKASSPVHNASRFNAQLRSNLGLAERPLHLPVYLESERSGHVSVFSDASNSTMRAPSSSPRVRSSSQQRRFPAVAGGSNGQQQPPAWATTNMSTGELAELFDALHRTLEHVPYAICGLGALIDHGFTARKTAKISIICPAHSKDNVKAWAAARGYPAYGDSVGLPMRGGALRRVRIKYLVSGFERLERARSSVATTAAAVLSLASQLDNVAAGWLDHYRRSSDDGDGDGDSKRQRALATIAADVFWCLARAAQGRIRLDPRALPTLLGEDFFVLFTGRHGDARPEMARAGIDVAAVLARHRSAAALREHDEMLRAYGLSGDLVAEQPGLFEGMRSLSHSKSVYTLGVRDSRTEESMAPVPLSLPLPLPLPALAREEQQAALPRKDRQREKAKGGIKRLKKLPRKSNSVREPGSRGAGTEEQPRDLGRSLTRKTSSKPTAGLKISGPIHLEEGV